MIHLSEQEKRTEERNAQANKIARIMAERWQRHEIRNDYITENIEFQNDCRQCVSVVIDTNIDWSK